MILFSDKLKEVSLKYCANLLDNQKVDKDFADEIECENLVHYPRMKEDTNDVEELSRDEFEKRLKLLATKSKEKYKFLLKSVEGFKNCIFRLFTQVWNQETKPQQWRNTVIIQLYKGKGEICNFDSQRNIHTKEDIPKLFEGLVVDKSKHQLVRSCSKYQIGGIPNHRSQEHLFTVKSVLSLYSQLNLPVILQLYDLSKYFDKEILKDAMDTLYSYGVRGNFDFDRKSKAKSTREIINNNSLLSIGHQMIKAKEKDKYLGDILHEGGLGKSVEATISDRYGKTFAAII